jgi:hypothetical protein
MRRAMLKLLGTVVMLTVVGWAIGHTQDQLWLGIWFLLFIFLGVPLVLLSIRDLLLSFFANRSESFKAWAIVHVCAVFAFLLGLLLASGARSTGHPKADLHQWLVLILPGLVYLAPVFLALHGNRVFLSTLLRPFRRRSSDEA